MDGCKPSFLEKPLIKQSADFKQVQFDCKLVADPEPQIQWLHNGELLDDKTSSQVEILLARAPAPPAGAQPAQPHYLASLILKGLVAADRTGVYKCVASNKFGSNFASINLNFVQSKTRPSRDGRAPKFPIKPVIRQAGATLTIECVVEASPRPTITYYHDHKTIIKEDSKHAHCSWLVRGPITGEAELRALGVVLGEADDAGAAPTSSRKSSSASSTGAAAARREFYVITLDIRHPKASDGGTYRCNAVNEFGESSANIALNFQTAQNQQQEKRTQEDQLTSKTKREQQAQAQQAAGEENKENDATVPRRQSKQDAKTNPPAASGQLNQQATSRATDSASQLERNTSSAIVSQPMEVDGGADSAAEAAAATTNRISIGAYDKSDSREQMDAQATGALPPAKRTSSTSSTTRRSVSVKKKKRPSLLGPAGEEAAGAGAESSADGEGPAARRVVKKRVSVKREAAAGGPGDGGEQRRESSASTASSQVASRSSRDRIPSVAIDAPPPVVTIEGAAQRKASTDSSQGGGFGGGGGPGGATGGSPAPRLSVSDTSQAAGGHKNHKRAQERDSASGQQASGQRRGTYDGLRAPSIENDDDDDDEDPEAEAERRRYLAARGGGGGAARESLSPNRQQQPAGSLLNPQLGAKRDSSPGANSRPGSAEPGRRGSILLLPDASDGRRPSIIVADDNKLRPGEIADRRRRSSIDVRRASAINMEQADKPSTPLRPCGSKPVILDFQDNISGTENQTSYLTFGLEGDPTPTLRFFKGDSEIYEGGRYSIVTDGDTNTVHFCIRKSKPMDEAKYKVIASNVHGEDSASMQLFVSDESGMDFRAMLKHRQYQKWRKDQDDPNWGNLKGVEEERLASIKEPKRPDNFLKPLQNQKVKQGRDLKVRFECVFSKSGVKAKWFRNNKEIFPNKKFHLDSRGDLHVLEIDAPYVEDGGKFTCQCLDTKCSAMLEVEEPDPVYKFTKLLAKGYGQHLARELVLEASCNSFKAQVNWYRGGGAGAGAEPLGEPLAPSAKYAFEMDKYGKKILRIKDCQFADSGPYACKIMNTPKDELTTTQVLITEKKFQIMKPLYSQRATEDDRIVLECEVDEHDAPVKWYRKDRETGAWKELRPEQLKSKEIVVEGKKRRLIIKKAKCQDEGEYKCCTNADETSCELFVEPSNKWRRKLADVTVVEDEPLVLEVELLDRKPGVAMVWRRNGKEVGHQGGAMQTTADERVNFRTQDDRLQLTIEHAKLSDAGDWSAAFNKMKCACKVTVLPAERAPTMRFPAGQLAADVGKPQVVEIPYSVAGTRQSAVVARVLCNGQPVAAGKIELLVKEDKIVMKLKEPQRADSSDNYEFVLENDKGKQAQKFKLDVQGPPGTPEGPLKVSDIFKDKCKLQWERPLDDGGCPIAHYVVERQEVGAGRTGWSECGVTSTCQLDVNDLSPKKEYKFRVRAVNKKGKSEALVAAKTILAKDPYDPPSEPENLAVVNWDKDFVDLQWDRPAKDGGVPIERYVIEAKGKFAQEWTAIKEVAAGAGGACSAHVTDNLKEGQQVQFRVRAVNKMGPGEPSKATKPVAIKARFVRPYLAGEGLKNIVVKKGRPIRYEISFSAEPAPEIFWLANEQELRCITDKCEIELGDKKTTLLVTNTTRADSGHYKLLLRNSSGECASEADVVVLDRPSAPGGPLVMEEVKSDQVTIKWRKPKDTGGDGDIDGYVVEKMNLETGRWVPAGECGPKDEMFTVKGLMKGKKYKFRVRAKNKEGESDPLETANTLDVGEEPTIQKCPSRVTVGQGETAKVKIHFQGDPSEIKITNLDTGASIGEAAGEAAEPAKYTVFDDYLVLTIPKADKQRHAGRYKVELKNKIGTCEAAFDLDVTGIPSAPQGPLEIGEVSENSVALAWRPPADDGGNKLTHYVVERRDIGQGPDAWIEVTASCKDTNFTVAGLTKDNAYEFRVMAVNENGQSRPLVSDAPTVAKLPYDPPSAPGQPQAAPLSEDSVRLEWERPKSDGGARITGYFVEKREVGSETWQKVNPNLAVLTNECVVRNLIEDRKYEFRVVAQNAAGLSEPSACSAQTLIKDPNATDVPKFVRPLKRTAAVEGGSFELECVVSGHPPPSVTWTKGAGKDLRDGGSGKYCMTQESGPDGTTIFRLLVTRAGPEDADEYSIRATNKAGSRTSRCEVDVQTKPKIHVPPRFLAAQPEGAGVGADPAAAAASSGGPLAATFDRGENIQLKIPFTGNPAPQVKWFKGDEEIEPSGQFDIETDGRHSTLTIRDATREDSGDYRLVVANALGEDSATFAIAVADRPEPPRFPGLVGEAADDAATLAWKAPLWDGGSQITQYVVEKRELPMTSWIRAASTRFLSQQVVNLNEDKDYEFRVFAENIYGRSEPSETVRCATKQSGRQKQRAAWPLDGAGRKLRSQAPAAPVADYDQFVRDGPAVHVPTDIKTCPITDNYEILERIGEGVFGEVYRVREKATGDYYAAKFTPTASAEERALLRKEIDVVNMLHHKNILRLHDAYEDDDEMVTVHEFISGPEVYERVCEPGYQMTEEQVKRYMRDVCEAVRHMHDRNVIHLDLKPENLVLQSRRPLQPEHEPKVKIVDFGLACKLDPHEICKISTSAADYAAPEILEHDSVGFYTDMWAVGVLTYTLLCGTTPFGSHADIKAAQWSFDQEPTFGRVTAECRDFLEKLLVKQKEKRLTAHECLEHPWLREAGDEETRRRRQQPLTEAPAYRRQRDAMRQRYLDWWDKSIVPIGHISNYSALRKLHADRYKIFDALLDRRELAPRFVIKPQSTFAYEGQTANFHCYISSDSPVTVSWFKDSRELKQSVKFMKRYTMDNNFTFNVNRCKMADFGEYVIRAENHHGWREEPVFLDVRKRPVDFTPVHLEPVRRKREPEPPKFEEEPDCAPKFNFILRPRIIQSGLSVKLLCCLKGKPAPTVSWLKDGKELSKRDYTIKHCDGVVTLEIAACDTSHTGKYTCQAENPLGRDSTTAHVLVEGKRTFTPTPMAGILAGPGAGSFYGSTYRHQRSLSLSRAARSATPPPSFAPAASPTLQAANLHLLAPPPRDTISATLYSPHYSMTTNRYLRRSYKAGPLPATTSATPLLPAGPPPSYRASRYRSRIPTGVGSRLPMRTLSSFGRSSSSLH